jgi:hypothetical protein
MLPACLWCADTGCNYSCTPFNHFSLVGVGSDPRQIGEVPWLSNFSPKKESRNKS